MEPRLNAIYRKFLADLNKEKSILEREGIGNRTPYYHYVVMLIDSVQETISYKKQGRGQPIGSYDIDESLVQSLFGLDISRNASKVYAFYLQTGKSMPATDVSNSLNIPRTETYHLINKLEGIGFLSRFGPTKKAHEDSADKSMRYPVLFFANHPLKAINDYCMDRSKSISENANKALGASLKYVDYKKN